MWRPARCRLRVVIDDNNIARWPFNMRFRDVDASALWCRRQQPLPVVKCCRVRVERRGSGRNHDPGLFATHPDMKMWSHDLAYVQRTGAQIDQSPPTIVRRIDPREAYGTRKDLCHSAARLHMLSLCQISGEFDVFSPSSQLHSEGATRPALAVRAVARIGVEAHTLRENIADRSAEHPPLSLGTIGVLCSHSNSTFRNGLRLTINQPELG